VFENNIEFNQAAFKHGISDVDIRHAIRHFIYEEQIDDGDDKHLVLGFDTSRRLLEIIYNVIDEHTISVFHAMKCRKVWRSLANL
jgi:predicted cupin superfamily sugar epimerase